ncbi:MAG: response regulator transcription factor [Dehalococcoidales bacterium]|nr:response regulator transcription factor [Dehalococcoidales bacterium]
MEEGIKVLIVDDHAIIREGLQKLLEEYEEIQVVGVANNGREVISKVDRLLPDVILMDIKMPAIDGIETTRIVKECHPEINIVILSVLEDTEYALKAIKTGATSYVQKDISADRLVDCIKEAYHGRSHVHLPSGSDVLLKLASRVSFDEGVKLTDRERQILELMAIGNTNKEIAKKLFISHQTVKSCVHSILQKLGATDRTEAVAIAFRSQIIE